MKSLHLKRFCRLGSFTYIEQPWPVRFSPDEFGYLSSYKCDATEISEIESLSTIRKFYLLIKFDRFSRFNFRDSFSFWFINPEI